MKNFLASAAVIGIAIASATPARATETINFDDLGNGVVVTNQYADVVFSSVGGSQVLTTAQSLGSSTPNFICSGQGGSINCTDPIFVDFLTAVSGLSFVAVGDNQSGINGAVSIFGSSGLLGTVNTFGDNIFTTTYLVDLSAFSGVTRIEITNSDPGGLGYDDFSFSFSDATGAVPEPATWAMMLIGFGGMGVALRRRRQTRALLQVA